MSEPNLKIKNIQTEEDLQQASEIFARCFSMGNSYYEHLKKIHCYLKHNPCYDPENSWLLEKDGSLIGEAFITIRPIRVGKAILRIGGIGGVCTEPSFRNQGYNKMLMKHCVKCMEQIGLDISLLDGIPNYYHRYGYAEVMPNYQVSIPSEKSLSQKVDYTVRRFKSYDLNSISTIYQNEFSIITGTQVRSEDYWNWHISNSPEIMVAEDTNHTVQAYIWLKLDKKVKIIEAGGQNVAAITSLLNFVGQEAQKRFQAEIGGHLHPQQPFARLALPRCNGSIATRYVTSGGWMGRMIHLQNPLKKLEAEFTRRLMASDFNHWSGCIQFETDLGDLLVEIEDGHFKVVQKQDKKDFSQCKLSQTTLSQMIFGYISIEDLINQQQLTVADNLIPLLAALFPNRPGYISIPDHF